MRSIQIIATSSALLASASFASPVLARATQLFSGFAINQLDVRSAANGQFGEFVLDRMSQPPGSTGFVNVRNSTGDWLVRNLPLTNSSTSDYDKISARLDLEVADGTFAAGASYHVDLLPSPVLNVGGLPSLNPAPVTFGRSQFAVGGVPSGSVWTSLDEISDYLRGPTNTVLDTLLPFIPFDDQRKFQPGHPNEQAANNQCAPMAVANSLQFLENTTPLDIPEPHQIGLRFDAPNDGDDPTDPSLVGELERLMNRDVTSRVEG
jgi:hypothetical protein